MIQEKFRSKEKAILAAKAYRKAGHEITIIQNHDDNGLPQWYVEDDCVMIRSWETEIEF